MKKIVSIASGAIGLTALLLLVIHLHAGEGSTFQTQEYATIRWSGRENTHLIRPTGEVEMLAPLLNKVKRPERVDERVFYLNIAMNALAKEGYELAAMTSDDIVMKRALPR